MLPLDIPEPHMSWYLSDDVVERGVRHIAEARAMLAQRRAAAAAAGAEPSPVAVVPVEPTARLRRIAPEVPVRAVTKPNESTEQDHRAA
jgi:hypothetical protein